MNRSLVTILSFSIVLSACGGGQNADADLALTKMHERMMTRLMEHAVTIDHPLIAKTTTALNVKILPASESYKGNASLNLTSSMMSDATNAKSPTADLTVTLIASADIPPGTPTSTAKPEKVSLYALMNARAVDRTLSVNFEKVDATAPAFLPTPFSLPEAISKQWYGKTFEELDAIVKDLPRENGELPQPPVDEILTNALRGVRMSPEQLERLGNGTHLWKGVELLPEKDGQVHVRVESDKKKVRETVRAFLTYIEEVSGPSWETQMRTNAELKTMMESLTKNDAEFLRTMGSIKGVISADKETYDITGFDGDIFDEQGTLNGHITFTSTKAGDFTIVLTDKKTNQTVTLTRSGDSLSVVAGDKTVVIGTVNSKYVDLTITDPETGNLAGSIELDITTLSMENIEISRGVIVVPSQNLTVNIEGASVHLSNSLKDFVIKLKASGKLDGKPLFTADFVGTRSEVAPFSVEKPQFLPFENLQQDFMGAFMPTTTAEDYDMRPPVSAPPDMMGQ